MNTYTTFYERIAEKVSSYSLDNLDYLTSYLIGLRAAQADPNVIQDVESQIIKLYEKKRGIDFLKHFTSIVGGTTLSERMKEDLLDKEDAIQVIAQVNKTVGKDETNEQIAPFAQALTSPPFHESFLNYEVLAHNTVVGALIKDLEPVIKKALKGKPKVLPCKKNTLQKLYQGSSIGKSFISIDLREANWSALRHWDPTLPNWGSYLYDILPPYTDANLPVRNLFLTSKRFRQVVLGVALKKLKAVKLVEETQVMLIKEAASPFNKVFGTPYSESNDEVIYRYDSNRKFLRELSKLTGRFRVTIFTFTKKTHDDMYYVDYNNLSDNKKYTLLRCTTPEKVEALL